MSSPTLEQMGRDQKLDDDFLTYCALKQVVLTKKYNNVAHYNKKLKLLNEFAHHYGLEFISHENDCELEDDVKPGSLLASISENRSRHRREVSSQSKRLKTEDSDSESDQSEGYGRRNTKRIKRR